MRAQIGAVASSILPPPNYNSQISCGPTVGVQMWRGAENPGVQVSDRAKAGCSCKDCRFSAKLPPFPPGRRPREIIHQQSIVPAVESTTARNFPLYKYRRGRRDLQRAAEFDPGHVHDGRRIQSKTWRSNTLCCVISLLSAFHSLPLLPGFSPRVDRVHCIRPALSDDDPSL